eukprot:362075_1
MSSNQSVQSRLASSQSCLSTSNRTTQNTPTSISPPLSLKPKHSNHIMINNKVTGTYISSKICIIVSEFWQRNIDKLSDSEKLEIGCSIFFSVISTNKEMKQLMRGGKKIESMGLKYLDMLGWLIKHLVTNNIDLCLLLKNLGLMHQNMGVNIQHFTVMLKAVHETFSYYFPTRYNIEVRYGIDEIFSVSAQVMTGQSLMQSSHLVEIMTQFKGNKVPFLKNLNSCLNSSIGREYLYDFLRQTWCDEIALFLKSLFRYKSLMSNKERLMVARDIIKISIQPSASFCLNLSYETRTNVLNQMIELEEKFNRQKSFTITADFFIQVEREMYKLIIENHWIKFVQDINVLHLKSFNVD